MPSAKRMIRKALLDVMQSEEATFDQRIKAARMLVKLLGLATRRDSRSSHAPKNSNAKYRLADLIGATDSGDQTSTQR